MRTSYTVNGKGQALKHCKSETSQHMMNKLWGVINPSSCTPKSKLLSKRIVPLQKVFSNLRQILYAVFSHQLCNQN
jgi:hypothetical protein